MRDRKSKLFMWHHKKETFHPYIIRMNAENFGSVGCRRKTNSPKWSEIKNLSSCEGSIGVGVCTSLKNAKISSRVGSKVMESCTSSKSVHPSSRGNSSSSSTTTSDWISSRSSQNTSRNNNFPCFTWSLMSWESSKQSTLWKSETSEEKQVSCNFSRSC